MEIFNLGSLDDELPRARLALLLEHFSELSDDRNRELRQRQSGVGGVGRQRVQGLQPLALVMGATRRLAVPVRSRPAPLPHASDSIRPKAGKPPSATN